MSWGRTGAGEGRRLPIVVLLGLAAACVAVGLLWLEFRPGGSGIGERIRLPHVTLRLATADEVELMVDPEPEAIELSLVVSAEAPSELRYSDFELSLADGTTLQGRSFSYYAYDPDSLYRARIPEGESTLRVGFRFPGPWVQPVALRVAGGSGELQVTSVTRRPPD
jgi:hypothetical protein